MLELGQYPRASPRAAQVDLCRSAIRQGLMGSLVVIEGEILRQPCLQLHQRAVASEVHILVLHRSPQALDEDVVQCAPTTIHTDRDAMLLEQARKAITGELRALIRVEDPRHLLPIQRLLQTLHTEPAIQGVTHPPAQHLAAVPIDHRHQVPEPSLQPDIRDV
jgi:hypothetical protein